MQAMERSPRGRFLGLASWIGSGSRSRGWHGYLNALAAVAITCVLRIVLEVLFAERAPTYMVFLAPVMAAALLGGVLPGLCATVLAWGISHFFFVDPAFSFKGTAQDWVTAGVFLSEGAVISVAGGRLRTAVAAVLEREERLAASEARLRLAHQAAGIATYEWELATGRSLWSENAEPIMGIPVGTFAGTADDSFRAVVPEDRSSIEAGYRELLAHGANEMEFRVMNPEGRLQWVQATGVLIKGENGASDRVVGVMVDVTERRRETEVNQFLADATAELARSLDFRSNIASVAAIAARSFADLSVAVLINDGQFPGEVVATEHRQPERVALVRELEEALLEKADTPGPVLQSIRSGTSLFLPYIARQQREEAAVSDRHSHALRALDVSSVICIPLVARERTLGALVFGQEGGRRFGDADNRVATEIGRRAALAIENSLLLDQSFEREGDISRANEALQLIADAGAALSSTLELNTALQALADMVVPRFADVCSIALVEGERLESAAVATADPSLREAVEAPSPEPAFPDELIQTAAQVIRNNRPVFLQEISEELLSLTTNAAARERLEAVQPRSLILMPLSARGQTLGVMAFMRVGNSPLFDRNDLSLAGQIARRTAAATDNARLYTEARRANDAKDEFLGMMSHELRTPITVIHGGARVLRTRAGNLDAETTQGLISDIERESERLSRMLENLLALARAELDREVVLEPVLLQRLLPRLVESISVSMDRPVEFNAEIGLLAVAAEPGYIEHIVRNLIGNAVKYSPPQAPIAVEVERRPAAAAIRVLDRGFGIAPDEAGRIFERFYRSDRTSRLAGGAGLGLAVCKRLVEAMSGEIWALPREGGGLEVGFSLPVYREEGNEE